jgi:integrase
VGKLFRRDGSPYWWARWYDAAGELQRESTRTADRRVASLFLSAREAEAIRSGAGIPTARRVSLADALGEYLAAHRPPVWSEDWYYTVDKWWRARLLPALGGSEAIVSSVTRVTVEAARATWLQDVEPPTVNRLCSVGSGFYTWCCEPDRAYALTNPFARWKRFAEVKRQPPPAPEDALGALLDAISNPVIRRAALISIDTALRISELRRVRWGDVQEKQLHVVCSYQRGTTKNKRTRWLLLTARALEALQAQQKEAGDVLFAGLPQNTRKAMEKARRAAKLEHVRWHDIRHYALTRAANAGVRPHDLRGMAGWVGDESGRYVHPEALGMAPFVAATDRQCAGAVLQPGQPSDIAEHNEHAGDTEES